MRWSGEREILKKQLGQIVNTTIWAILHGALTHFV